MSETAIDFIGDAATARRVTGRDETVLGLKARVAHLEALIELRDEEIARLRAPVDMADLLALHLDLTPFQARMLAVLMTGRLVRRDYLATALYGLADRCPDDKTFDVMLCQIRRKIAATGAVIETIWGVGWHMSAESRAAILRASEGAAR